MGRSVKPEDATPDELAQAQQSQDAAYAFWMKLKAVDIESRLGQPGQHPLSVPKEIIDRISMLDADSLRLILVAIINGERSSENKIVEMFKREGK